jgi:uncharacterized protein YbcI
MASYDPKFVEYFSPSVKISDVISSIKDLYFGKGPVNIYEKFLDEIKSVMDLDKKIRNRMPSYDQYYDPKFAEDFSPSVKISVVISSIKDLYFGKGPVNIDEKFLDEIKSVLESKIAPGNLPLPNEMLVKIFSYLDLKVCFCHKILMFLSYLQTDEHFIFLNLKSSEACKCKKAAFGELGQP